MKPLHPRLSVIGRLFQARMWREYALMWDRRGLARDWAAGVLRVSREKCLQRARVNVYLARRLNRQNKPGQESVTGEQGRS